MQHETPSCKTKQKYLDKMPGTRSVASIFRKESRDPAIQFVFAIKLCHSPQITAAPFVPSGLAAGITHRANQDSCPLEDKIMKDSATGTDQNRPADAQVLPSVISLSLLEVLYLEGGSIYTAHTHTPYCFLWNDWCWTEEFRKRLHWQKTWRFTRERGQGLLPCSSYPFLP